MRDFSWFNPSDFSSMSRPWSFDGDTEPRIYALSVHYQFGKEPGQGTSDRLGGSCGMVL